MTPTPANDNRPEWFDRLLIDYQPFIYKRCVSEPNIDVEETAQEITLHALEKWHQYRPTADDGTKRNFAVWLSFMCRDVLRSKKREGCPVPPPVTPATQEYAADIPKALALLNKREARAVTLHAMEYTVPDICRKLGVKRRALYGILERARAKVANDNEPARKAG